MNPAISIGVFVIFLGLFAVMFLRVWQARKRIEQSVGTAVDLLNQGKHSEALRVCDAALEGARKLKLRPDDKLARTLVLRSMSLQRLGRKDDALAAAAEALACMCTVKNGGTQLAILDQAGTMLLETGHDRRAIPLLDAAVRLAQQIENEPNRCYRLQQVGLACARVGIHANSVAAFGKAIEVMTKEVGPDSEKLSNPYVNLGNSYKQMQKLDEAERCYLESKRLLEINNAATPEKLSLVLLNLGVVCAESGRNQDAENYYRQVLELRSQAYGRNDWRIGNTYNNLARCRQRENDLESAEDYIQKAIAILEVRPATLCHALETLSRIREDQGRLEEALAAVARARETMQNLQTPELSQLATFLEREAMLAGRMGDEDRSQDCRARANQIRQAVAAAPAPDHDSKNVSEMLRTLDQQLQSSLNYVNSLQNV
jgi:tetratricopeptide (TPR) repeat protein